MDYEDACVRRIEAEEGRSKECHYSSHAQFKLTTQVNDDVSMLSLYTRFGKKTCSGSSYYSVRQIY